MLDSNKSFFNCDIAAQDDFVLPQNLRAGVGGPHNRYCNSLITQTWISPSLFFSLAMVGGWNRITWQELYTQVGRRLLHEGGRRLLSNKFSFFHITSPLTREDWAPQLPPLCIGRPCVSLFTAQLLAQNLTALIAQLFFWALSPGRRGQLFLRILIFNLVQVNLQCRFCCIVHLTALLLLVVVAIASAAPLLTRSEAEFRQAQMVLIAARLTQYNI